jgi:glutaredoxin
MRSLSAAVVVAVFVVACNRGGGAAVAAVAASDVAVAVADAPVAPRVRDDSTSLLFSFVDAGGRVVSVPTAAAVPEAARKRVLVVDLAQTPEQRQAHRFAFFADLSARGEGGEYPVVVVSRYDAAAGGAAAPVAAVEGSVVVYSAAWCGYCKKTKAWLKEHGVAFVDRDVEKTPGASAELSAKLKAAHIPGGGIPVVDWGGDLVVGFDVAAYQKLLGR